MFIRAPVWPAVGMMIVLVCCAQQFGAMPGLKFPGVGLSAERQVAAQLPGLDLTWDGQTGGIATIPSASDGDGRLLLRRSHPVH